MSEKNLVICDREITYANALAENIAKREELNVKVYTFASLQKAFLFSQGKPVHILLVDEDMEGQERVEIGAAQQFVLVHGGHGDLLEKEKPIFKYQCASQIIQEVFEIYVENSSESILKEFGYNRTKLEAVYSPVRGIGKTRFAIAMGKEWAAKEKVLYLNMEEYPGFETEYLDESRIDLGDLLYFIKQREGHLSLRLQSAVRKMGNLDYVPPVFLAADLKAVKREEWVEFLDKVRAFGFYDRILLDLGESLQGLFSILEMCDTIYMPVKEDENSNQKTTRYETCLKRLKLDRVTRMTRKFILPENVEEYVKMTVKEEA